ncbi:MAG: tryptophan--tRNA ligase [Muribaculaceae bacterium]|nr:tryptophan--tRNA ligase [Bacteroides sp.]MDE6804734.1 tryptophan--tRNA ligase [Muribaculaceae bacterium]MDE7189905.1 tryptophan--tRNA ligase [Muribaculaceae bacterium]
MHTTEQNTPAPAVGDDKKKVVLSGIRATGNLHLGNYYGALNKFVRMQDDYDCRFFIADLHALTTHPDPKMLHENVKDILAEYLAAGLDPDKNILYVQSDIPEISEMYLLMNMHVGIGELMRTASFKDKARKALGITSESDEIEKEIIGNQTNQRVNAGLLTYPTLMAVDILIHKADFVPVGKDQEQHLELTRRFARRFNSFYKTDYFGEPVNFNFGGQAVKVPGLDGSGKMGKSEGNCIYLIDDEKTLRKKVMRAVTDEGPKTPNQPVSQPVENLFTLMELVSTPDTVEHFRNAYADCSIRYGDMKKQLAEDILKVTLPIRERILDIRDNDEYLARVVRNGAERTRALAADTLRDVREIMGIRKF